MIKLQHVVVHQIQTIQATTTNVQFHKDTSHTKEAIHHNRGIIRRITINIDIVNHNGNNHINRFNRKDNLHHDTINNQFKYNRDTTNLFEAHLKHLTTTYLEAQDHPVFRDLLYVTNLGQRLKQA